MNTNSSTPQLMEYIKMLPAEAINMLLAIVLRMIDAEHAIDYTAGRLGLCQPCVFHMRHKILPAFQDLTAASPVILSQAAELDETFVREISNEYICIHNFKVAGKINEEILSKKNFVQQAYTKRILCMAGGLKERQC